MWRVQPPRQTFPQKPLVTDLFYRPLGAYFAAMGWKTFILRKALAKAETRPRHNPLITSEPASLTNNCFVIRLSADPDPRIWTFVFERSWENQAEGLFFEQNKPGGKTRTFDLDELVPQRFEATHYYRGLQPSYTSPLGFLVGTWVGLPWWLRQYNRVTQFFYNQRRLTRRDRIRVLQTFLENTVNERGYRVGEIGLSTTLYGKRWHRHSQSMALLAYYGLVLESLEKSGDLVRKQYGYELAPQGIATLHAYEEDERRHADNVRIQWILAGLTAILAMISVVQIYIAVWQEVTPDPPSAPTETSQPG